MSAASSSGIRPPLPEHRKSLASSPPRRRTEALVKQLAGREPAELAEELASVKNALQGAQEEPLRDTAASLRPSSAGSRNRRSCGKNRCPRAESSG